jgi:hypothetical protein
MWFEGHAVCMEEMKKCIQKLKPQKASVKDGQ